MILTSAHFSCLQMAADPESIIDDHGTQRWYKGGKLHREDGPAIIFKIGAREWYKDGKIHRDGDLPAVLYHDGDKEWWRHGKRHRDGDLPDIIWFNGDYQTWSEDTKYHREIGPAHIRRSKPPKFYEHGKKRSPLAVRGETVVGLPPASWSPVMCFM